MSFEVIKWVYNKTFVKIMKNTVHFRNFENSRLNKIGVVRSSMFIPSLPVLPAPAESPPLLPIAQAAESGPRCQLRMPAAT